MECAVPAESGFEMLHVYNTAGWPELRPDSLADCSTDTLLRAGWLDDNICTAVAYNTGMQRLCWRLRHSRVGFPCFRMQRLTKKTWSANKRSHKVNHIRSVSTFIVGAHTFARIWCGPIVHVELLLANVTSMPHNPILSRYLAWWGDFNFIRYMSKPNRTGQ